MNYSKNEQIAKFIELQQKNRLEKKRRLIKDLSHIFITLIFGVILGIICIDIVLFRYNIMAMLFNILIFYFITCIFVGYSIEYEQQYKE